jgi:hypothetical protein
MIVAGVHGMFPLSKLDSGLSCYYMDARGDVFSNRQNPKRLRKLIGTVQSKNCHSFIFTPDDGRKAFQTTSNSLRSRAYEHPDFIKEATIDPLVPLPERSVIYLSGNKEATVSLSLGIKKKGWVIAQVNDETLVLRPKTFLTLESVKSEVQRLATQTPDVQFVYLKIEGAATASSIIWE